MYNICTVRTRNSQYRTLRTSMVPMYVRDGKMGEDYAIFSRSKHSVINELGCMAQDMVSERICSRYIPCHFAFARVQSMLIPCICVAKNLLYVSSRTLELFVHIANRTDVPHHNQTT